MRTCLVPDGWVSTQENNDKFDKLYIRIKPLIDFKAGKFFGMVSIDRDDLSQEGLVVALRCVETFEESKATTNDADAFFRYVGRAVDRTFISILAAALAQKRVPHEIDGDGKARRMSQVEYSESGWTEANMIEPDGVGRFALPDDIERRADDACLRQVGRIARHNVKESLRSMARTNPVTIRALQVQDLMLNPPIEFLDSVKDINKITNIEMASWISCDRNGMGHAMWYLRRAYASEFLQISQSGDLPKDIRDTARRICKLEDTMAPEQDQLKPAPPCFGYLDDHDAECVGKKDNDGNVLEPVCSYVSRCGKFRDFASAQGKQGKDYRPSVGWGAESVKLVVAASEEYFADAGDSPDPEMAESAEPETTEPETTEPETTEPETTESAEPEALSTAAGDEIAPTELVVDKFEHMRHVIQSVGKGLAAALSSEYVGNDDAVAGQVYANDRTDKSRYVTFYWKTGKGRDRGLMVLSMFTSSELVNAEYTAEPGDVSLDEGAIAVADGQFRSVVLKFDGTDWGRLVEEFKKLHDNGKLGW